MKVLIAEDNADNMDMLSRRLRRVGFEVCGVGDGRQAVETAPVFMPDVILMDVSMPIMSGLEATRSIREAERGGVRTPIIMLTAHAMESDRERCLAAGCDAFATKPVDFRALLTLILHLRENAA